MEIIGEDESFPATPEAWTSRIHPEIGRHFGTLATKSSAGRRPTWKPSTGSDIVMGMDMGLDRRRHASSPHQQHDRDHRPQTGWRRLAKEWSTLPSPGRSAAIWLTDKKANW